MGQRLVRAKTRIRDAGIPFGVPETEELPERLQAVLDAIYAAYAKGWNEIGDAGVPEIADEAIWLGRLRRLAPARMSPRPRACWR